MESSDEDSTQLCFKLGRLLSWFAQFGSAPINTSLCFLSQQRPPLQVSSPGTKRSRVISEGAPRRFGGPQ